MKKMILMSALVLCAGSLFGMENPEPQTFADLYNAILSNTNNFDAFASDPQVAEFAEDAREEFRELRGTNSRTHAELLIAQLKAAIEAIVDPKNNPTANINSDKVKKLSKALLYLQKLKELIAANPMLFPR